MDDFGTPTNTAIKGVRILKSSELKSRKTTVILYEPTIHSIDLTKCNTFGDALRTIKSHTKSMRFDPDVFVNRVRPGAVPGAFWAKDDLEDIRNNWSKLYFPDLNILPVLRGEYTVQIVDSRPLDDPGRLPSFDVEVKSTDTVADLKEQIRQHTGISPSSQRLDSQGTILSATNRLIVLGIDENTSINLTVAILLWFELPQMSISAPTFPHTPLHTMLRTVSDANRQALTPTIFQISHSSGHLAPVSKQWLPGRKCLFTADDAFGTVGENGLREGDRIKLVEFTTETPRKGEPRWIWTNQKLLRRRDRLRKMRRRLMQARAKGSRSLESRDRR